MVTAMALPVNDAAVRRISPTDVSQFIRLEQCQRYLRLRLHARAHGPRFLYDYGVAPQSIPPLLTRSGAAFEQQIEAVVHQRVSTQSFADDGASTGGQRPHDNQQVIALARDLVPGAVLVLLQPRLRGDIDLVRLERDGDGEGYHFAAVVGAQSGASLTTQSSWSQSRTQM